MNQNLDTEMARTLEHEVHTQLYPGTEIMKDVGSYHFVKATTGKHSILVPQPSNAEHDPLNWSPFWKGFTIFSASIVTFAQAFAVLSIAPMFGSYIKEFHSDLPSVIEFTGTGIIALGFSNFIWVPVQTCFGRRPVLIFSSLLCFASLVWKAKATSYNSFMGACALNGIGARPSEAAQPTIIADIIFLHDRGKYQTLYFSIYFGALAVGPIISGPMAEYVGSADFWWLNVALIGFAIICSIFTPETRFSRSPPISSLASSNMIAATEPEAHPTESLEKNIEVLSNEQVNNPTDPWLGRGRPSKQQWKIFQPYEGNFFFEFWLPLQMFFYPIIQFSCFVVSFTVSGFLMVNLTEEQAFAVPPYNFSSSKIGYFNFATLVGILIGLFTAGPLSDIIAAWLTKRNNGIREPEMRLLAILPYAILMIIGNVIVAVGYQRGWHWAIIVIVGYTLIGIQTAALPSIAATYAVDSYKPVAGAIFVAIIINKNMWGWGLSKFITNWIVEVGFVTPIMTNLALQIAFCLTAIIFWFYGKTFRKWTKDSKLHAM